MSVNMAIITVSSRPTSDEHKKLKTRKPRDAAAVLFGLKFTTILRVAKLRKPGFRAPNKPAQNRI